MSGLNVFGSNPAGLTAFTGGGGNGDDFRAAEHVGKGAIMSVSGVKDVQTKAYGEKPALECSKVVVLDGDKTEVFEDVLIFNAAFVKDLKGFAGQTVVVLIGSYETKQGGDAPSPEVPTAEILAAAEKYQG